MFYNKVSNRKKLRKFKKRTYPRPQVCSMRKTHKAYIYHRVGGLMELRVHKLILRKFRRRAKRRKFRVTFFFLPNYSYSKKSTNSRMGKGKGKVRRLMALVRTCQPLVSFRGISFARILRFTRKVWRTDHVELLAAKSQRRVILEYVF